MARRPSDKPRTYKPRRDIMIDRFSLAREMEIEIKYPAAMSPEMKEMALTFLGMVEKKIKSMEQPDPAPAPQNDVS